MGSECHGTLSQQNSAETASTLPWSEKCVEKMWHAVLYEYRAFFFTSRIALLLCPITDLSPNNVPSFIASLLLLLSCRSRNSRNCPTFENVLGSPARRPPPLHHSNSSLHRQTTGAVVAEGVAAAAAAAASTSPQPPHRRRLPPTTTTVAIVGVPAGPHPHPPTTTSARPQPQGCTPPPTAPWLPPPPPPLQPPAGPPLWEELP